MSKRQRSIIKNITKKINNSVLELANMYLADISIKKKITGGESPQGLNVWNNLPGRSHRGLEL